MSFIDSNEFPRGHLTETPEAGSLTNVGNPAEELYRRNVIVGGCKIIYIEINSFVRTMGV